MANTICMEFAMMGYQSNLQPKLFYYNSNLEKRIPPNHILRKIKEKIDFNFIYAEVKDSYGENGNVSVPPPSILKMMLLLILYNVRSERELMDTVPLRLDWLWFLDYDMDTDIPDHSVLSKARARWGVGAFKSFFERIVWQCVEAGLIDGSKLFVDASLVDANASNNSVVDMHTLKKYLNKGYRQLEKRLDDLEVEKITPANNRYISTTDPDASVTRHSGSTSKLRYKTHRVVDPKHELITATKVTPGSADDGDVLEEMIETHEANTQKGVDTVVADSKYGTIDNFLLCRDQGIKAHIASLKETHRGSGRQKGIFPKEVFSYHPDTDIFTCPAGHALKRRHYHKNRKHYEYKASSKICAYCELREKCTRAKDGRTLKRHARQDELDIVLEHVKSRESKKDIKTRKHLSERSFAQSTRYGYKRARWRRLWRMEIQDFLIAAIQNITVLITHTEEKISKSNAQIGHILGVQRAVGQDFPFLSRLMELLGQLTKSFARYKEFLTPQRSLICTVV
jgi:transposase